MSHDELRLQLKGLLHEAAVAAAQPDPAQRFAVSDRLMTFVEESTPNDDVVRAMDAIATKAAVGLLEQTIDERVKSIAARNAELALLTKQVQAAGAKATEDAAAIRFEKVAKTIDALNGSIAAFKDLRDELRNGSDAAVLARIDEADKAVRKLRDALGG